MISREPTEHDLKGLPVMLFSRLSATIFLISWHFPAPKRQTVDGNPANLPPHGPKLHENNEIYLRLWASTFWTTESWELSNLCRRTCARHSFVIYI